MKLQEHRNSKLRLLTVFVGTIFLSVQGLAQECASVSITTSEATRPGANLLIKLIEKKTLQTLTGRVVDVNGASIPNALIEVFDNPEWILNERAERASSQKRILGCKTAERGLFNIKGLKKGEYEMRVSLGVGFNVSYIYVKVDPKHGKRKELIVTIEPGT